MHLYSFHHGGHTTFLLKAVDVNNTERFFNISRFAE